MVKVCRVPMELARKYFTDHQLSGLPSGISWDPRVLKARRKYRAQNNLQLPVDYEPVLVQPGKVVSK